jgi:hypothetical protein
LVSPHNNLFVNLLCLKLTTSQAPVWLLGLQPIKAKNEGLENLQLKDNSFKDTLQALVRMHFKQQQAQNVSKYEYDIVRGKGKYNAPLIRAMYVGAKSLSRQRTCAPAPWGAWCWKDFYSRYVSQDQVLACAMRLI